MLLEKSYRSRLIPFLVLTFVWSGLICLRLFYLQVVKCEKYTKDAIAQQESSQGLESRRGTIFDRNGKLLAVSVEAETLSINPQVIKNPSDTLSKFARILNMNSYELMKNYLDKKAKGKKSIFIKRKLAPGEKKEILKLDIDKLPLCKGKSRSYCESKGHMELHFREAGIFFQTEFKRYYPKGSLASHVIGGSNIDEKGLDGVESKYDSFLKGEQLHIQVTRDAAGNEFPVENIPDRRKESHLVLTVDEVIQHIAERELTKAFDETHAYRGCAIVMDPSNGEILALANRPAFDPNHAGKSPDSTRKNISLTDLYEPGSTFKVIGLSILVEQGKFDPNEIINCGNGSIKIAGVKIDDHHPYDYLSALEVIEKSSNVGVIRLNQRFSDEQFYKSIKSFGFGEKTGIDLPGEVSGSNYVRPPARWSKLSHASLSIGQEILVTPMQMLTAYSALANGGNAVQPHVAKGYIDPDDRYIPLHKCKMRRTIAESTARAVTGALEGVVLNGTGKKATIQGYFVAGKTGTAQIFDKTIGAFLNDRYVASFIGYAPSLNPEILCLVMLDLPRGKIYYGGDVAAPVFSKIVGETLYYLQTPPNRETLSAANYQNSNPQNLSRDTASPPFPSRALLVKNQADLSAFPYSNPLKVLKSDEPLPMDVEEGIMPDLSRKSLRDALGIISTRGCQAKVSGKGYVTTQCPEAGAAFNRGDVCFLLLSDDLVKLMEQKEMEQEKEQEKKEGKRH